MSRTQHTFDISSPWSGQNLLYVSLQWLSGFQSVVSLNVLVFTD